MIDKNEIIGKLICVGEIFDKILNRRDYTYVIDETIENVANSLKDGGNNDLQLETGTQAKTEEIIKTEIVKMCVCLMSEISDQLEEECLIPEAGIMDKLRTKIIDDFKRKI